MTTPGGGATTVLTTGSTAVSSVTTGSLADVKVGDNVVVEGTTSGTTISAQQILVGGARGVDELGGGTRAPPAGAAPPAGDRGGPPTSGVVTGVSNGSLTVSTAAGTTVTVATSTATTVSVLTPSSVDALRVGDQVQVTGTTAANGTITATSIRSGAQAGFGRGAIGGRAPGGIA